MSTSKKNEKWHEIEDRKAAGLTRKMIKRNNINSNERCKRRLAACVKVLDLFEKGKIEAAPDKVNYWKQVIENDGLFTE